MEGNSGVERPKHRRNASSKSGVLKSFMTGKTSATKDNAAAASFSSKTNPTTAVLGERHFNIGSSTSPMASNTNKEVAMVRADRHQKPRKTKSISNLSSVFSKLNRSTKDVSTTDSQDRNKENAAPQNETGLSHTPIWAEFASKQSTASTKQIQQGQTMSDVEIEIARYTPIDYAPSKQRNFCGSFEESQPRTDVKDQSSRQDINEKSHAALSTTVSRFSPETNVGCRGSSPPNRRSGEEPQRKTSSSSAELPTARARLGVLKRGGRVLAAVAALQGTATNNPSVNDATPQDPKAIDEQFEAVLTARQIPEPMRQKMRTLTMRVKMDFIRQDQSNAQNKPITHKEALNRKTSEPFAVDQQKISTSTTREAAKESQSSPSKRSRPRSRTFTFSKSVKHDESSPTKRSRPLGKERPVSIHIPQHNAAIQPGPPTPTGSLHRTTLLESKEFVRYLQATLDPKVVEVGRLHKLRILLRNETVSWVDDFISQGGLTQVVDLIYRIIALEWREDHEDQLLHETLLCLKGLCSTDQAMLAFDGIAEQLFGKLLKMLFDEEKKGPAEYSTRAVVPTILFSYLAAANEAADPALLMTRATRLLQIMAATLVDKDAQPLDFVQGMHVSRPYKLWCREISNVTKEVFWIFLHHLNVIPLPRADVSNPSTNEAFHQQDTSQTSYASKHFPPPHPPVPAAPYIGGVEWDATTYITSHLDLVNALIASLPSCHERNALREELQASGFEKVMGITLRTCKEKFYSGVHDCLRAWVAAATEDGWNTRFVREGPDEEDSAAIKRSPRKTNGKGGKALEEPPKLELKLDLTNDEAPKLTSAGPPANDDDGWLL